MSGGVPAGVKLSPCPFCGSEAEFFGYQGATKAKCSNEDCEAETGPWFVDIDCNSFGAAAKNWNTRATPTPPIEGRDADVERAREAAITAMGWTDPRMIEDGKRYLAGHRFATFGFGGECFLTAYQVEALRRCHDGARAALQALGERG